jgi:hypothetical protein
MTLFELLACYHNAHDKQTWTYRSATIESIFFKLSYSKKKRLLRAVNQRAVLDICNTDGCWPIGLTGRDHL